MSIGTVCPNCGARGDSHNRDYCSWTHVAEHWRPPPRRRCPVVPPMAEPATTDELRQTVLDVLREHGPLPSANRVVAKVPRQRALVLAALRGLAADGLARRNGQGWEATS